MVRRDVARGIELFQPMLATSGKETPAGDEWVFEPKYDGIRIIALVLEKAVALVTRNGNDKCGQFPEISDAMRRLHTKLRRNVVLDGEIVALNGDGSPGRFQDLQGRMHLLDGGSVTNRTTDAPAAFIAFDMLVDGEELLVGELWEARRKQLERALRNPPAAVKRVIRISDVTHGDASELSDLARASGWEGIMAKRRDCPYEPGRRVRHWQKIKMENQQELVVGGWTEPRNSRTNFGALLLGYYNDDGRLIYAGHTGTGFTVKLLDELGAKLRKIERKTSPFSVAPKTNEAAHWVEPKYVAEVRFNEWTAGGHLRQPVFLGLRDDKEPAEVRREKKAAAKRAGASRTGAGKAGAGKTGTGKAGTGRTGARKAGARKAGARKAGARKTGAKKTGAVERVVEQLRSNPKATALELDIPREGKLDLTNLGKVFFPVPKVTKGRLLEYYAEVSPYLLRALADRPLVLKRYPNGISADAFYQQKAPDKVPDGIRVEEVADEGIETQRRIIAGDLKTLLYIVQLGAISTDPWHSRVDTIADADYAIVDLDPGPKANFRRVVQVARWVKETLDELGLHGVAKTSGASGIHIGLPLPAGASYEISRTLAELVARKVVEDHPKETTIQRAVKSRPEAAVYVDYLQNIRGKTVASVYSARAETHATVSTPLRWDELTDDLEVRDFTVDTVPPRLGKVGDLWAEGMRRPNLLPGIVGDAAA